MIKYGLKLWSTNDELFGPAIELIKKKSADFIELYVVPGSFSESRFAILRGVEITLHAPHDSHGLELTRESEKNGSLMGETLMFADYFKPQFIVVHPGFGSVSGSLVRNAKKFFDSRFLLENMPRLAPPGFPGSIIFGERYRQIKEMASLAGGICLDFEHAAKAAASRQRDYKRFILKILRDLSPRYFHISDADLKDFYDEHLDLGSGDLDIPWIKKILEERESSDASQNYWLVFETPKTEGLENDMKNLQYFKQK